MDECSYGTLNHANIRIGRKVKATSKMWFKI